MFGYIRTDDPYLYKKDDVLFRSLYCGVCKAIGGTCGQVARLSLTYDIAFLSAIAHNFTGKDVAIKKAHCIIHPITKRPIAGRDELTDALAEVNVILAYHKLLDDVYDEGKGRARSAFLKPAYKRAKKKLPEVDEIVCKRYKELFALEKEGCASLDRVCDPFSKMLEEISDVVFKDYATDYTRKLFYYLGKWIYLIDALDDYDKDVKKNDYNVFRLCYGSSSADKLLKEYGGDMKFIFETVFSEIADCTANIKFYFNKDLVGNILLRGVPAKTDEIIRRITTKC